MDLTGVAWRKSSYSGGNGGTCVEFAVLTGIQWRKSSYSSGNGGACVEVASLADVDWRKSTYSSGNGGTCVEVADLSRAVAVRDSKDPGGPALVLTPAQWRGLTARIRAGSLELG